jgi:hypothetical protein
VTIRVALAVVLAAALVAASLPAVEQARVRASDEAARHSAHAVADAARDLARESDPVPGTAGARRTVALDFPRRSLARAEVAYLVVGGRPDGSAPRDTADGDVIAYRVRGGPVRSVRVPIDLRVVRNGSVQPDHVPLVVRGDARLTLRLGLRDGHPVVVVSPGSTGDVGRNDSSI